MENEQEIVRITLYNNRIVTVKIKEKTADHISGNDKYGVPVIIPFDRIKVMVPWMGGN